MKPITDGPVSPNFKPVPFAGHVQLDDLSDSTTISPEMAAAVQHAPGEECVAWGIPFEVGKVVVVSDTPVSVTLPSTRAHWFVFMHTSDVRPVEPGSDGFISPMRGAGQLNEQAANYVLLYDDGTEVRVEIRRRHQIGAFSRRWGENCFQAVAQHKPSTWRPHHEQMTRYWGGSQTRVDAEDDAPWNNWLWAWENPHPEKAVVGVRFEPVSGVIVVSAIAAGEASEHPLRWRRRRKAVFTLPEGVEFQADLDAEGALEQIQLDMGQVISALPRLLYPDFAWSDSYNNQLPQVAERDILIEYTAHPDACFHLWDGSVIPVSQIEEDPKGFRQTEFAQPLGSVVPSTQRVNLKVVDSIKEVDYKGIEFELSNKDELRRKAAEQACDAVLKKKKLYEDKFGLELIPKAFVEADVSRLGAGANYATAKRQSRGRSSNISYSVEALDESVGTSSSSFGEVIFHGRITVNYYVRVKE